MQYQVPRWEQTGFGDWHLCLRLSANLVGGHDNLIVRVFPAVDLVRWRVNHCPDSTERFAPERRDSPISGEAARPACDLPDL